MRPVAATLLTTAVLVLASAPARACDPYWDQWCDWYDPYWDIPGHEVPAWTWWEPQPVVWTAPHPDDLDASTAPEPTAVPVPLTPDPIASATALGLHMVDQVFAGHTVVHDGPVTTFGSTTIAFDAGTAARLISSVGTGETTAFDSVVLGGRMTLSDGRAVAGDIYENRIWTGSDWVVNAYVFFQDDSEVARLAQASAPIASAPPALLVAPASARPTVPQPPTPVAYVAPIPDPALAIVTVPSAQPSPGEDATPPVTTLRTRVVRAGLALAPQADVLRRIEVLRGRRIALWVRAFVDEEPARVVGWQLRGGEVSMLGPISGSGDDPVLAAWRTMPPQGSTFAVSVRATVEVPGESARDVDAVIEVVVRSPAIVE